MKAPAWTLRGRDALLRCFFVEADAETPVSNVAQDPLVARLKRGAGALAGWCKKTLGNGAATGTAGTLDEPVAGAPAEGQMTDPERRRGVELAIAQIQFEADGFADRLRGAAAALERWVGPLPASERHHDADAGGLIRHSVRALLCAARPIGAAPRMMKVDSYLAAKFGDRIRLAIAMAVLYHDAGKIYDVAVGNEEAEWDPLGGPLTDFCRSTPGGMSIRWRAGRGAVGDVLHHSKLQPQAILRIVPPEVWSALAPIGWWLLRTLLVRSEERAENAVEAAFARVLLRIVPEADHAATEAALAMSSGANEGAEALKIAAAVAAPVAPAPAATPQEAPAAPRARRRPILPGELVRFDPPAHKKLLSIEELRAAIDRCGANAVDSPILLGGMWVAVDREGPAYDELVKSRLATLTNEKVIGVCNYRHMEDEAAPKAKGVARCMRGTDFESALAVEPIAEADKTPRNLIFIHALAFDGPIPAAWGAFPGRIEFAAHGARLNDFRKVLPGSGRELLVELTAAMAGGELAFGTDWFVLTDGKDAAVEYIGLAYEQGVVPLVGEQKEGEEEKAYASRLYGMWDRIVRMRRHVTPAVWRIAHTIQTPKKLELFVFDRSTSQEMLKDVGPLLR